MNVKLIIEDWKKIRVPYRIFKYNPNKITNWCYQQQQQMTQWW